MKLLADTSIIIALIAGEEHTKIAELIKNHQLCCSSSIHAEVGNAISAMFKQKRITLAQATEIIKNFEQLSFEIITFDLHRSIQISHQYQIYAYDAYVLECAHRHHLPLMTLDNLMKEKAKQLKISLTEV